jgi:hypothetical protein
MTGRIGSWHLFQLLCDDGLKRFKRDEALNDSPVDQQSGYDLDAHFPRILAGVDDKGPIFMFVETLAKDTHLQVQFFGKAVQLLSSERLSCIVLKKEVMVGPKLPLVLGAMGRFGGEDSGLAVKNKIKEDDLHQSGIHVFLLDLTGRLFGEMRRIRSMELGE